MSTISQKPQTKAQKAQAKAQALEAFRDLAGGTVNSLTKDVLAETSKDFFKQFMGGMAPEKKVSGELVPGETLEIKEAVSGQLQERKKLEAQLINERRMRQEEQALSAQKTQELRIQLSALTSEVSQLAQTTEGLSKEVQVAAMEAPVNPGVYHIIFFEKLIEFVSSFRKKIEDASVWLASYNAKSKRKHTFWGQVGVGGGKRLLSSEDYIQRAAA